MTKSEVWSLLKTLEKIDKLAEAANSGNASYTKKEILRITETYRTHVEKYSFSNIINPGETVRCEGCTAEAPAHDVPDYWTYDSEACWICPKCMIDTLKHDLYHAEKKTKQLGVTLETLTDKYNQLQRLSSTEHCV